MNSAHGDLATLVVSVSECTPAQEWSILSCPSVPEGSSVIPILYVSKRQNLTRTQGFLVLGLFKPEQMFVFTDQLSEKGRGSGREERREGGEGDPSESVGLTQVARLSYFTDVRDNGCYCSLLLPRERNLGREQVSSRPEGQAPIELPGAPFF